MSLTKLLIPTYIQMLERLSDWLKKAESQFPKNDAEALLLARLAPDMFPLSTQIRFACVQAHEAVYRLKGESFPDSINNLLEEGRNAGERPGSLSDAYCRITETITFLKEHAEESIDTNMNRLVPHELPNGMVFNFTAEQYMRDWTLGQFYFHLMIAYSILRKEKVELGKADYVSHMFAFLRPETTPEG